MPTTNMNTGADLTSAQAAILDKFADIQAELACLVRETKRTHTTIKKKARRKYDRQ